LIEHRIGTKPFKAEELLDLAIQIWPHEDSRLAPLAPVQRTAEGVGASSLPTATADELLTSPGVDYGDGRLHVS
jgi:hypothetical protein